jgi:hypothetical protein
VSGLAVAAAGLGPTAQAAPPSVDRHQLAGVGRAPTGRVGSLRVRPRATGSAARVGAFATRPANGAFVQRSDGRIFRIAGGAPLYVSTWTAFGGKKPVAKISDATYNALSFWPADGTFVKTAQDGRIYRFVGGAPAYVSTWAAFGGKPQPALIIDKADIDHAGVEADPWFGVNRTAIDYPFTVTSDGYLTATSLDGRLFVKGGQTGRIYKMIGGAPQYVSTWSIYGGAKPALTLDQNAIDKAGTAYPYGFLRNAPIDQWLIKSGQLGHTYVVAGGAPLYIATPAVLDTISDGLGPAKIDEQAIQHGGEASPWNHLRYVPADETFLAALTAGQQATPVYQVTNGIPARVYDWDDVGGLKPFTYVDELAISNRGTAAPWNHLLSAD